MLLNSRILLGGSVPVVKRTRDVSLAAVSNRLRPGLPNLNVISDITNLKNLGIDAPEVSEMTLRDVKAISYVSRRRVDDADFDPDEVDEEGLPLVYNETKIATYWKKRPGDMAARWAKFVGVSGPWLTKMASAAISGKLEERQEELSRDAVDNLEKLGPTFIKLGQILSIRPDVLPPKVMAQIAKLQDRIEPFDTVAARLVVEKELGRPIMEIFSEFSEEPIAAASLAQVYKAVLRESGETVAVKVQRPAALATISKDMYVLRRAVGFYERLITRFTAQTTDYQQLLSTFAEGLYTEMDFRNEALNAQRMRTLLDASEFGAPDIVIPMPFMELTTRRVHTMEWIEGVKLTGLDPAEIRSLVKVGQDSFLTQLLEIGFFHGDPHPGNLLKVTSGPNAGKLCLLDFGLVAEIPAPDRAAMVAATIHLANKDWNGLVEDFISLGFLPVGCDRGLIIPVMERILGPYLRGGGAKAFNFQMLSQDLLAATLEIPFSVPPYMSLIARSVVTLEGIALLGDPQYQMVAQAYPFVVRKVLRNDSSNSSALLGAILIGDDGNVRPTRVAALLQAALGFVAGGSSGFVDFDALPEEGASVKDILSFLLSDEAQDLRPFLVAEMTNGLDLIARDALRRAYTRLSANLASPPRVPLPFIGRFLPPLPLPSLPEPPVFVPGMGLMRAVDVVDLLAPPLTQQEEVVLKTASEVLFQISGIDGSEFDNPSLETLRKLVQSPPEQVRDLANSLSSVAGEDPSARQTAASVASDVVEALVARQAERMGVPGSVLFPLTPFFLAALRGSGVGGAAISDTTTGTKASSNGSGKSNDKSGSSGSGKSNGSKGVGSMERSEKVAVRQPELVMVSTRR